MSATWSWSAPSLTAIWTWVAATLLVPNVLAGVLLWLGLRETALTPLARLRKRASICLGVVALGVTLGAVASGFQIYEVLRADSVVDPSIKARELADGISGMMNFIAAGAIGVPLPLVTCIVLAVRAARLKRKATTTTPV